jgi:hypothetical protein
MDPRPTVRVALRGVANAAAGPRPRTLPGANGQADADRAETPGEMIADQAVFTSARSATGEGYRIVAASGGINPTERQEITRRSPSHSSLCDESEQAKALSCYPLAGGRWVVACSRAAGQEHSGRGGVRVFTHIAVVDAGTMMQFECDPVRLWRAFANAAGAVPPTPPQRMERVPLGAPQGLTYMDADRIRGAAPMAAALLQKHAVVATSESPWRLFEAIWLILPAVVRRGVSVSAGLKFAPTRKTQLTILDRIDDAAERSLRGHQAVCFRSDAPPTPVHSPYDGWIGMIQRYVDSGRTSDVRDLAARLTDASPGGLGRIAALSDARDLARVATSIEVLHQMQRTYAEFEAASPMEQELLDCLRGEVARGCERLERAEASKTSD